MIPVCPNDGRTLLPSTAWADRLKSAHSKSELKRLTFFVDVWKCPVCEHTQERAK